MRFTNLYAGAFLICFFSISARAQVLINEYSCSNVNSWADNFSEYEDFIELYNTTGASINLTGWYLSDNNTKPTKWQLGNVSINANGFLRIWASGRNINTGTLHANFKLTQCKQEEIVLTNPAGTIIDSLTIKPALRGHSRGRTTNGAATWSVFTTPTPNASNSNPQQEYATRPSMNLAPGFYTGTQIVTITSPDPNITIRYTTNGNIPTAASTAYTAPVAISATTVLRARAFSSTATIPASFIESNTYFINSPHTVEVISVYGDQMLTLMNDDPWDNFYPVPEAGLEYFDAGGNFRTEGHGITNKHGNDSWYYEQKGIDFINYDQYGYNSALQHQIFNSKPRTEYQRIIIKASAGDNYPFETPGSPYAFGPNSQLGGTHIRDQYVHTLSQKAGLHLDERTWAPGVLYVNGSYWGLYDVREKVDDADFTDFYHNSDSYYQYTVDQDSLQFLKDWGGVWAEYGGATAINDWTALRNFITGNNMAIAANYNYVDSLFSVKSFTDYFFINNLVVCKDWLNWNTAWWRGKQVNANKRKWRYTLWDMDATFDHYVNYTGIPSSQPNADPCNPQTLDPSIDEGHIEILNALLQNPTFKQYYVMRYFDLMNNGLSCNRMITVLDSMVNVISPEMPAQITRWNSFTPGRSYSEWLANVQDLRNFILARCDSIVNGFAPCNGTTGPYVIKVNVDPPGSGTVDVNSINVSSFVWSGTYPGGVNMNFTAHANAPYCFDRWEFQNHTPLPSINDSGVYVNLTQTDSIIAHFIISSAPPTASATATAICPGDTTILSVNGGSTFSWAPSSGLSCTTCANPVATPTVTTTYTVTASGSCISGTDTITINITSPGAPTASASSTSICPGDSTVLSVNGGNSFSWAPSTGLSCTTCPNPVATPTVATTYTVIASGTCISGTATVTISMTTPGPPTVTAANPSICIGTSTTLSVNGGNTFTWSPSTDLSCTTCPNPVASPTTTTTYSVVAFGNCIGGTGTVTVNVTLPPDPNATGGTTLCGSNTAQLSASGGTTYTWSTGETSAVISVGPTSTTTYFVVASTTPGCDGFDSVVVFVTGECPDIFVPTGFSPNGDNNNDMLFIFGEDIKQMDFKIFNRWGEVVFETKDKKTGWDGTFRGKDVQSGVYAYNLIVTNGAGKETKLSGNLTVVR